VMTWKDVLYIKMFISLSGVTIVNITLFKYSLHKFRETIPTQRPKHDIQLLCTVPSNVPVFFLAH